VVRSKRKAGRGMIKGKGEAGNGDVRPLHLQIDHERCTSDVDKSDKFTRKLSVKLSCKFSWAIEFIVDLGISVALAQGRIDARLWFQHNLRVLF
jgi:hypothetical protein